MHTVRRTIPLASLFILILLGCSADEAPSRPPTPPPFKAGKPTPPLAGKPNKHGYVTLIHPMVTRLGKNDPIRLALHWENREGPIPENENPQPVSWETSLELMTFIVTTPDGKEHALSAKFAKPNNTLGTWPLFQKPTLIIALEKEGPVLRDRKLKGKWTTGDVPNLNLPGKYVVKVKGDLVDTNPPTRTFLSFESEPVTVEVGVANYKPIAELETLGAEGLEKFAQAKLRPAVYVIEDVNGNRLVRVTGETKKLTWGLTDYTLAITPEGKLGEILTKEVNTCLAKGTTVSGEGGPIPIENVRPGMRIWGYDLKKKQKALTTVRSLHVHEASQTLTLNHRLQVTATHPLYVDGQWKTADSVRETDLLLNEQGQTIAVEVMEEDNTPITVYDLTVDEPHNFFANGLLVHNKDRAYSPEIDDVWYRLWPLGDKAKK